MVTVSWGAHCTRPFPSEPPTPPQPHPLLTPRSWRLMLCRGRLGVVLYTVTFWAPTCGEAQGARHKKQWRKCRGAAEEGERRQAGQGDAAATLDELKLGCRHRSQPQKWLPAPLPLLAKGRCKKKRNQRRSLDYTEGCAGHHWMPRPLAQGALLLPNPAVRELMLSSCKHAPRG